MVNPVRAAPPAGAPSQSPAQVGEHGERTARRRGELWPLNGEAAKGAFVTYRVTTLLPQFRSEQKPPTAT